jgi:hypothetical protein
MQLRNVVKLGRGIMICWFQGRLTILFGLHSLETFLKKIIWKIFEPKKDELEKPILHNDQLIDLYISTELLGY